MKDTEPVSSTKSYNVKQNKYRSVLLPAQNGGTPLSKIYNITPALQISISLPYLRRSTSGAT